MSAATKALDLWSVRYSYDINTSVHHADKVICINVWLGDKTTKVDLYKLAWHVAGLTPNTLLAITASPPCTTTTLIDNNNKHRNHKHPNHVAITPLAIAHDKVFKNWFKILFA